MKRALYVLSFLAFVFLYPSTLVSGDDKNSKTTEPARPFGGIVSDAKAEKILATFEVQSFKVIKDGMVSWTSKNESGSLPYIVEQFIFDKWVTVAKINGVGSPTSNSCSVPVILNSGENKFRVKQKGYDKMSKFSDAITYYSKKETVTYSIKNKNQLLEFSSDTYFIVYNPYEAIVKQG